MIERDITERKQAEQQQEMLLAELNHRVKNALATVLSIASRTRKVTDSLDEFYHAFEGRLRALASTHDLLAKNVWSGADLRQVLLAELEPYNAEKGAIQLSGRNLFVSPRAAVVFGMIFHELATNAAKYGALSGAAGNVGVTWKMDGADGADTFVLDWLENGGPGAEAGEKQGFGLKFIERSIAYELQGTAELRFDPGGLHVRIRAPMSEVTGDPGLQ